LTSLRGFWRGEGSRELKNDQGRDCHPGQDQYTRRGEVRMNETIAAALPRTCDVCGRPAQLLAPLRGRRACQDCCAHHWWNTFLTNRTMCRPAPPSATELVALFDEWADRMADLTRPRVSRRDRAGFEVHWRRQVELWRCWFGVTPCGSQEDGDTRTIRVA
jgi:hypothetical protein